MAGPSGVGKGAIVAGVRTALPDLLLSVSATTRPPRPSEVHGRDYHFLTPAEFERLVREGGLLEWAKVFDHAYGTPREPVEAALAAGRDVLLEVDVQGARQVRASMPGALLVLVEPPTLEELARRLRARGTEAEDQLVRRLATAKEELAAKDEFDHVVVNAELDRAVASVVGLVRSLR